jgi:hypothetical protein
MADISLWSIIKVAIVILILYAIIKKVSNLILEYKHKKEMITNQGYADSVHKREMENRQQHLSAFNTASNNAADVIKTAVGSSLSGGVIDEPETMIEMLSKCKTGCKSKCKSKCKTTQKAKSKSKVKSKSKSKRK